MTYIGNKENRSKYKVLAQAQPSSKNTTQQIYAPNSNEEVHILSVTVVNLNNKDVDFVLYMDEDGDTYNDSTTIFAAEVKKDDSANPISNQTPIFMDSENNTLGFEASDTDVTITVWGAIYDIT